ncbi:IS3 family transposase [Haemophilus influenzae]
MKKTIQRIKANHPDYGYRRVHASLPGVNHKKVQRLIQTLGLQVRSRKSKKFTTYRGTIGHIAPNRLERDFSATARNKNGGPISPSLRRKMGVKSIYLQF